MKNSAMDWVGMAERVPMATTFIHGRVTRSMNPVAAMGYFHKISSPMVGAAHALTIGDSRSVLGSFRPASEPDQCLLFSPRIVLQSP